MKEKRLLSLLLTVILSIAAFAQNQTFTGIIVDSSGEPVIGATIVQKGTSNTVASDFDGSFSITCPAGAELEISFVGYGKQIVKAGNDMRITLLEDLTQHLTTRADDNRAPPVFKFSEEHPRLSSGFYQCQVLVRFFALLRIKPHVPPLVRVPVNSFKFHTCVRTPQAEHLSR